MTSGMQPVFTTPNTAPVAPLGAVGNIWSATDIANSSPFPGVGLGLPKKFVS